MGADKLFKLIFWISAHYIIHDSRRTTALFKACDSGLLSVLWNNVVITWGMHKALLVCVQIYLTFIKGEEAALI